MHIRLVLLFAFGLTAILHSDTAEAASVDDFIDFSTGSLPGRLYIPPEAIVASDLRPLILFLHGAGETGSNNLSQINGNIDNLLSAAKERDAFLYAPQATSGNWHDSNRTSNVMAMIDKAIDGQNIDPDRLYVTGLSMGGGGTWNMLNRFADRFAAGVPIAAVSPSGDFNAMNLVEKPTWAFHARNDGVVPKTRSRNVINNILSAAGERILTFPPDNDTTTFHYSNDELQLNYTEWPTGGHGIWSRVYDTTEMYDWMFSQSTSVPMLMGDGATYFQDFDSLGLRTGSIPPGWTAIKDTGQTHFVDGFGLRNGLMDFGRDPVVGVVNVGGNAEIFGSSDPSLYIATWMTNLDGDRFFNESDVIVDGAIDRALGHARVDEEETGILALEVEIVESPLRAFVLDWDLEVWGGQPDSEFRGSDGGGFNASVSIGNTEYYSATSSLVPGQLFDTQNDGAPGNRNTTLIDGNEHAQRKITSGIVEVDSADGAIGNTVNLTFDANYGNADKGWISAIDNVQLRALAAGDAQGDGDVDPADLIQLLAGGAFGQGNINASWEQGDFDNDGDFDGTDILAVVQGLAGEFPKTYAHDPNNGVPDVLINPATGNITLDTNGTTIGSIVMDSAAGIFNGPNSPMWDAPGDFAADIDTQISMPISFTNPGYNGVDDLGDGIIGNLAPGFDILSDLTIKYLDPNGDLSDAEAHVVPEPSGFFLLGLSGLLMITMRRRLTCK